MPPAAHPDVPTPCRLPRQRRSHSVRFTAFDLGKRPHPTAHVAEDPLRACPAPLGDVGLPPAFGPARPPPSPRLVACGDFAPLMPCTSRRLHACRWRRRSRQPVWRELRIIVAGDVLHVHLAAGHDGTAVPGSSDHGDGSAASQRVDDDRHGAPASPRRPLHVVAFGRNASWPDCLPRPPCGLARLAAFGVIALAHAVRLGDSPRRHDQICFGLAGAGFARHQPPHFSILYCTPLPRLPAACSAPPPSIPSALPATPSPPLPSASFAPRPWPAPACCNRIVSPCKTDCKREMLESIARFPRESLPSHLRLRRHLLPPCTHA